MEYIFGKSATLGEFTGDSHIDYAIASRNSLIIFESDGDGTFSNPTAISVPDTAISLNSADFNLDGRDDLALGTKRGLKIYRQTGKQTFVPVATYPQDYGSVDLDITNSGSDFNSDGKFDLCIASPSVGGAKSKMMIYYGNGDGTFNQTEIREINGQILATCVGDFNNDTELDIAFVNGSSRYVGIIFGDGNGNFDSEIRYQSRI
ncbi:MAG: VCBS repeat-containing protein [bacterium]|nr:VCBS repeat-containing protein [bacterium]